MVWLARVRYKIAALIAVIICFTGWCIFYYCPLNLGTAVNVLAGYTYQDTSDEGIVEIVSYMESRVPESEGGVDPEIAGWKQLDRHIQSIVYQSPNKSLQREKLRFLDAGCGFGRLMLRYCRYFGSCVCLEPDTLRIQVAQDYCKDIPYATFENIGAQQYQSHEKYNVVISSQVIQHVPVKLVGDILTNLVRLTATGGVLVVISTHFPDMGRPVYEAFCTSKNATCMSHPVSKEGFESIFFSGKTGILPVHFWSQKELMAELVRAGCHIIDIFTFTYFNRVPHNKALLHGLSEKDYLDNPISQGIVCTPVNRL